MVRDTTTELVATHSTTNSVANFFYLNKMIYLSHHLFGHCVSCQLYFLNKNDTLLKKNKITRHRKMKKKC